MMFSALLSKLNLCYNCSKFRNTYNHKYDGYIFVHENGDMM